MEPRVQQLASGRTAGRDESEQTTGSPTKFTLIYSGHSARRRHGWHVHIIVVRNRWEKAWLYFVLGAKNILQQLKLYGSNKSLQPIVRGNARSG